MKRSSAPRKTASLSPAIYQKLNAYALAASAAGVGILALTQPAQGKIVYRTAHRVIDSGDSYKLDFTGDGATDLTLQNKAHSSCNYGGCTSFQSLVASMPGSNQVVRNISRAAAMKSGMWIGSKRSFRGGAVIMASIQNGVLYFGNWVNVANRYLGVKFKIKGKMHYGWARLSVQVQSNQTIAATLTGYAYETIPNKSIVAGQTHGPESDLGEYDFRPDASLIASTPGYPRQSTLGLLALGAQGVPPWRRKEEVEGAK